MARRANDAYFTLDGLAEACVNQFFNILPSINDWFSYECDSPHILEPSVGGLSFARAVAKYSLERKWQAHLVGVDIVDRRIQLTQWAQLTYKFMHQNIMSHRPERKYDYSVGNPPYISAEEHLWHIFESCSAENFAAGYLLRMGFLESAERVEFFKRFPVYGFCPIAKRPSFTGDGKTDGTAYAFVIWIKSNGRWQSADNIAPILYDVPESKGGPKR